MSVATMMARERGEVSLSGPSELSKEAPSAWARSQTSAGGGAPSAASSVGSLEPSRWGGWVEEKALGLESLSSR